MIRHVSIPVLLLALASSGCGADQEPCIDGCPDISGVYAIEHNTPVGECPFSPYLLGPTVQLLQSDNGRRVILNVIDPSTQLEVPLTGDVYAPEPRTEPERLGSFQMNARTVRSATRSSERTVTLDVRASGSVFLRDNRRMLSAMLTTTDLTSNQSCSVTLSVMGEGS